MISRRLASRLKEQVMALNAANSYNSNMQDLGQKLSTAIDLEQVQKIAESSLSKNLSAEVWFYFPESSTSSLEVINSKEKISADWTFKNHQPSGRFTQTLTENDWWFLPLLASKQCFGVVGVKFLKNASVLNTEQKQLTETMVEYIAQAISRTQLTKALENC